MSRSPAQQVEPTAADDYLRSFGQVYRLVRRGRSFSGREPNTVFLNTADGRFADVSGVSGVAFPDDARALATGDWDGDGDVDLWIANRTAPRLRFLRNDTPHGDRYLALRLRDSGPNRDAIGARVELFATDAKGVPLPVLGRSLHAGGGFLSQSSKTLHFGLGETRTIERGVVHWPGGEAEIFSGLEPGGRYLLERGTGLATALPSRPAVALAAGEPPAETAKTPRRAVLVSTPPMPDLAYRSLDGSEMMPLSTPPGGALLVNLWASWCLPCHGELRQLVERRDELLAARVWVLALSVDGLDAAKRTTPAHARSFLESIDFPGTAVAGLATAELLAKLELLLEELFARHLPIAVPTSLLIDQTGRLAAVYRGPVEVDELLADVAALRKAPEQRRASATPFPGRWLGPPQGIRLASIAHRFLDEGWPNDAELYLEEAVRSDPEDAMSRIWLGDVRLRLGRGAGAGQLYRQALELQPELAAGWRGLARWQLWSGAADDAVGSFQRAIELARTDPSSHYGLGLALQDLGRLDAATTAFRDATVLDPSHAEATSALATLLALAGDHVEAIALLERALELDPAQPRALNTLGVLLFESGDTVAAIARFRGALELDPATPDAARNLEKALAGLKDGDDRR